MFPILPVSLILHPQDCTSLLSYHLCLSIPSPLKYPSPHSFFLDFWALQELHAEDTKPEIGMQGHKQHVLFCAWVTSLSITSTVSSVFRPIPSIVYMFHLFYYPLISWWTPRLIHFLLLWIHNSHKYGWASISIVGYKCLWIYYQKRNKHVVVLFLDFEEFHRFSYWLHEFILQEQWI